MRGRWQYWAALACSFAALDGLVHAFAIASTVRSSTGVPDQGCDAACRVGWVTYGHTAYGWLALSLVSVIVLCLLLFQARRHPVPAAPE